MSAARETCHNDSRTTVQCCMRLCRVYCDVAESRAHDGAYLLNRSLERLSSSIMLNSAQHIDSLNMRIPLTCVLGEDVMAMGRK
jgi:hypothetical protein